MTGWEQNGDPGSFLQAPVEEAAERLAEILREENADVVTVYDWHGNYGHPDHIKVHTVGHRAAELAGTQTVFEATMNREHIVRMMETARQAGASFGPDERLRSQRRRRRRQPARDAGGRAHARRRRVAPTSTPNASRLRAHRSQVTDTGFFLQMPEEAFAVAFGTEWFIKKGAEPGPAPRLVVRMTRLYLVRHGRAAAGWDTDPDPGSTRSGSARLGGRRAARSARAHCRC